MFRILSTYWGLPGWLWTLRGEKERPWSKVTKVCIWFGCKSPAKPLSSRGGGSGTQTLARPMPNPPGILKKEQPRSPQITFGMAKLKTARVSSLA